MEFLQIQLYRFIEFTASYDVKKVYFTYQKCKKIILRGKKKEYGY